MANQGLRRRQLDTTVIPLATQIPPRPKTGWISEIRRALMLTTTQLAKRVGIDQSTASRLEQSEVKNTITLESLERMAKALGCELRYVFVPAKSLERTVFERAAQRLSKEDARLEHTLALEEQKTRDSHQQSKEIRTAFLIEELGSRIWDDE